MPIRDRIAKLDRRAGWAPRQDETRRDFLLRFGKRRGYVPAEVYLELVELHDRVERLEARSAELRPSAGAQPADLPAERDERVVEQLRKGHLGGSEQ